MSIPLAINLSTQGLNAYRLTDGPEKGNVIASEDGKGVKNSISRADLSSWMIAQLGSETWVKKSPIIGA